MLSLTIVLTSVTSINRETNPAVLSSAESFYISVTKKYRVIFSMCHLWDIKNYKSSTQLSMKGFPSLLQKVLFFLYFWLRKVFWKNKGESHIESWWLSRSQWSPQRLVPVEPVYCVAQIKETEVTHHVALLSLVERFAQRAWNIRDSWADKVIIPAIPTATSILWGFIDPTFSGPNCIDRTLNYWAKLLQPLANL